MKLTKSFLAPFILIFLFLFAWQVIGFIIGLPFILPTPVQVIVRLWELKQTLLFVHLPATILIILTGLSISIVFGVALAVWMNVSRAAQKALYPIIVSSQTIPIIALAPIFVLWFGYSIWSKVAVTVIITFFPITVSTFDGLRSSSKEFKELLLTMGASKRDVFFKLNIPSALPFFYSGLKVAVTLSVIGAAIGEWLGAEKGLGYFSKRMMTQFDGAGVFAPIVLLSAVGIALFLLVVLLEKITLKWRKTK